MVVRAGYGIYYDQINTTTMRGVVAGYPGFITSQIANDSRSGALIPNDFFPNLPTRTFPESAGTAFNVASDSAESPYTHQMTLGSTRQLGTDYAVSFDYVYMRGESFPVTRNVNARRADNTFPLIASRHAAAALRRRGADAHPPGAAAAAEAVRQPSRLPARLHAGQRQDRGQRRHAVEPLRPDGRLRADRERRAPPVRVATSSTSCRGASRPARSSPPTRRRPTTSSSAPTPTATATTSIARPASATTTAAATGSSRPTCGCRRRSPSVASRARSCGRCSTCSTR